MMGRWMGTLFDKIAHRAPGIALYGLAPPKRDTPPERLAAIAAQQVARLRALPIDGVVVYDIQDEAERMAMPRPFPFLPTVEPEEYAARHLAEVGRPAIVYRSLQRDTRASFTAWLDAVAASGKPRLSVLVGAPSRRARGEVALDEAYALARTRAPNLMLGGIAIAERHGRRFDEHQRMLAKTDQGCRFFITQAVYDVTSTKSLLSDYALALDARGAEPVPIILTFSPCGSAKTLAFMQWLGIAFPRWLENELRHSPDPLATSLALCEQICADATAYARTKRIPLGINVESISIRRPEIEAAGTLLSSLQEMIGSIQGLVPTDLSTP